MINFFISILVGASLLFTSNAFALDNITHNQKLKKTEQLLAETADKLQKEKLMQP